MKISDLETLLNQSDLKENTRITYFTSFKRLVKEAKIESIEDLTGKKDKILEYLNSDSVPLTSKKNLLNSFLKCFTYLNVDPKPYTEDMHKMNKEVDSKRQYAPATEKEKENHITMEELINIREKLKKKLTKTFTKYDTHYVLMCLYTMLPPLRSECFYTSHMYIKEHGFILRPESQNYVCLTKKHLVLNTYKTMGTHGQNIIDLPDELVQILLSYREKTGVNYLVCNAKCEQYSQSNFTKLLNAIIGKKVSSTQLRRIYISSKNDGEFNAEERKKTAKIMGHELSTQALYYTKFSEKLHAPVKEVKEVNKREQLIKLLGNHTVFITTELLNELEQFMKQ